MEPEVKTVKMEGFFKLNGIAPYNIQEDEVEGFL